MPIRIDVTAPPDDVLERLIQLGALDVELIEDGVAAILPDAVALDGIARVLGVREVAVSPAISRDDGSVWLLRPRAVRIGSLVIAPAEAPVRPGTLRLTDSPAFGTGHHPTTALCIEALEEAMAASVPDSLLDVGTGSGVLALAALMMGVPQAVGVDIDPAALETAVRHAQLNGMSERLRLVLGGPDSVEGVWLLVVANVLAAASIDMAPSLVKRVAPGGQLILSGVPTALESEVRRTYERLGMRQLHSEARAGWAAMVMQTSW